MKKLASLLLSLCMLCGAWMMACAEELPTQTYNTPHYSFDLPANLILAVERIYDDGYYTFFDSEWDMGLDENSGTTIFFHLHTKTYLQYSLWDTKISINHSADYDWISWDNGLSSLKEYNQYMGSPFSTYDIPLNEKSMPDGVRMAYGSNGNRVAYMWCDGQMLATFTTIYFGPDSEVSDAEVADDLYNHVVLPFFQSIRPVGTEKSATPAAAVTPVQDVAAEGKQVVRIGDATFQIDADLVIKDQSEVATVADNDRYHLELYCFDWDELDIDIVTTGDIQFDNMLYILMVMTQDFETSWSVASNALSGTADMLNGGDIRMLTNDSDLILTHYYRGTGFWLLLAANDSNDSETVRQVTESGIEILQSFRLDGVSEERMIADAEAAAAFAAEAEARAAMQKYVVITADSGKIRTEASISGGLIKTAYKGETFPLKDETGDWYIVDVDGRTGYIHKGVAAIQ